MTTRQDVHARQPHSLEVRQAYERALAGTSAGSRFVDGDSGRVHLLEEGSGPPLVLLHATAGSAAFFLPLMRDLHGVRALAPDRPGQGMSDPINLPRRRYRAAAVAWVDRLLDALELDATSLLGHSGGGLWALWYALAHPDRVTQLVLIGVPAFPMTRCPLPVRLVATPGVGELISRLAPPTRTSVLRFADYMGEKPSLAAHPDLLDLMVAAGRDPIAAAVDTAEFRAIAPPFALLSPSGFRRGVRVQPDELRQLSMRTLVVWGERDPIGSVRAAQLATGLIPQGELKVLSTGHMPWLAQSAVAAERVSSFMIDQSGGRP